MVEYGRLLAGQVTAGKSWSLKQVNRRQDTGSKEGRGRGLEGSRQDA